MDAVAMLTNHYGHFMLTNFRWPLRGIGMVGVSPAGAQEALSSNVLHCGITAG